MQKYSVSIPQPCHQNWNAMTPNEQGKFCHSCQKTVTDFTTFTDQQFIEYFSNTKNHNGCGRFLNKQIQTISFSISVQILVASPWQKFLAVFCIVFGSQLYQAQFAFSQDTIKVLQDSTMQQTESFYAAKDSTTNQQKDSATAQTVNADSASTVFTHVSLDIQKQLQLEEFTTGPLTINPIWVNTDAVILGFSNVEVVPPTLSKLPEETLQCSVTLGIYSPETIQVATDSVKTQTAKSKKPSPPKPAQPMNEMLALAPHHKRETEQEDAIEE